MFPERKHVSQKWFYDDDGDTASIYQFTLIANQWRCLKTLLEIHLLDRLNVQVIVKWDHTDNLIECFEIKRTLKTAGRKVRQRYDKVLSQTFRKDCEQSAPQKLKQLLRAAKISYWYCREAVRHSIKLCKHRTSQCLERVTPYKLLLENQQKIKLLERLNNRHIFVGIRRVENPI